jgi:hypothetical protein
VLVIIALPDRDARGLAEVVDAHGCGRFVGSNNGRERSSDRFPEIFTCRGTAG